MKNIILILLVAVAPAIGMSQSGTQYFKVLDAASLTSTSTLQYIFPTSSAYDTWSVFIQTGTVTATTATVKLQVSPDNMTWVDYSGLSAASLTGTSTVAWEDDMTAWRWMRLNFTIPSGYTVPVTAWYIFKRKN